jgi:succinate-semialdehyde dehydrogenase / glutarate-semialdehyde dehydrogenase
MPNFPLFIAGNERDGSAGRVIAVENPADETLIGNLAVAEVGDLDDALISSQLAFAAWRNRPAAERGAILRQCASAILSARDRIALAITADQGKPLDEARGEVDFAAEIFEWYASEGQRAYGRVIPGVSHSQRQLVLSEPLGPVVAMTPWNFPVATPSSKLAAGLAAGCSIILKAAETAPGGTLELVRVLHEAGLPQGLVNLVYGVPAEISAHLLASPIPRGLHFTGSTTIGRMLAKQASARLLRLTLELGGHAPVIVCEDADPVAVARLAAAVKFYNAGQVCTSPTRFYVHSRHHDAFVEELSKAAAAVKPGPGTDPNSTMGPVVHGGRLKAMEEFVADAVDNGAHILAGGTRLGNRGYFFAPTVLTEVPDSARIMRDEPFGPVVPVQRFDSVDTVIAKANSTDYGLAAYAFSASRELTELFARKLEAGMVAINGLRVGYSETPFGGIKQSGYGLENGAEGMQAFLVTKFVSENNSI